MAAMPQYLYRIQPTRPAMLSEGPTEQDSTIVAEHFGYLQQLAAAGQVLMAGRTTTADEHSFGLVVFTAASDDAAHALMSADPAVRQGVMRAELFPFRIALWSAAAGAAS